MVEAYIDGSSLGNPGKSGIGYVVYENGKCLKRESVYLGEQTNNYAEYMALIFCLVSLMKNSRKDCRIYSDSELLCRQFNGVYKVKNKNIYPLFVLVKQITGWFRSMEIIHVPREKNREADALARKASAAV